MPVTIQPTSLKYKNSNNEFQTVTAIKGDSGVYYGETEPSDPNVKVWIDPNGEAETFVQDVQVNGTSAVTDGIANVPLASTSTLGVVKINPTYGITALQNGELDIINANISEIKAEENVNKPITPSTQHVSTFYGLAKLAGADMASSSNPVGTYTEEAKIAIQKMLGIYEAPWELIREDTFTNETEADHIITMDGNGNAFELTDIVIQFETPKQEIEATFGGSGAIAFYPNGYPSFACECSGYTQAANASAHGCVVLVEQKGNAIYVYRASSATTSNNGNLAMRYGTGFPVAENSDSDRIGFSILNNTMTFSKIIIRKITGTGHYKLYGKRKWQ